MSWLTVYKQPVRTAAVLTNSFVYSSPLDVSNINQVCLLVDFTIGSLTDMLLAVQVSYDSTNWYDYEIDDTTNATTSAPVLKVPARSYYRVFDATCSLAIQVPLKAAAVRFGVKGEGTVTSSSCAMTAMLGVA